MLTLVHRRKRVRLQAPPMHIREAFRKRCHPIHELRRSTLELHKYNVSVLREEMPEEGIISSSQEAAY